MLKWTGISHIWQDGRPEFTQDTAQTIREALFDILGTVRGERPMRPNYGSEILRLVHENFKNAEELARIEIIKTLSAWEDRIDKKEIQVSKEELRTGLNGLTVEVRYVIKDTGEEGYVRHSFG